MIAGIPSLEYSTTFHRVEITIEILTEFRVKGTAKNLYAASLKNGNKV